MTICKELSYYCENIKSPMRKLGIWHSAHSLGSMQKTNPRMIVRMKKRKDTERKRNENNLFRELNETGILGKQHVLTQLKTTRCRQAGVI